MGREGSKNMRKNIKEIVITDELARERVENKKEERNQVQLRLREQNKSIEIVFQKEAQVKLDTYKIELEEEFSKQKGISDEEYEKSLGRLLNQYNEKKEFWLKSIYENCLNA